MVAYIITAIAGLVVGFVAGALVYRNNVKRLQASEARLKRDASMLKEELKKVKEGK